MSGGTQIMLRFLPRQNGLGTPRTAGVVFFLTFWPFLAIAFGGAWRVAQLLKLVSTATRQRFMNSGAYIRICGNI